VEKVTCRLLPFSLGDGPTNMAADEVLLQSAQRGVMSLRFYGWTEVTLSLGYFQAAAGRESDPKLRELPFVRRPTGGATLVHDHELTYALALPAAFRHQTGESWLNRMHRIIASALAKRGIACRLATAAETGQGAATLCFQQFTPGDLLLNGSKIAGSAERRQKGCLLQHGAILLKASPHASQLPGILEQAGFDLSPSECQAAIVPGFQEETDWDLVELPWDRQELANRDRLVIEKYSRAEWNNKR
jgi:lipoyl(octanoyl) transferase